MLAASMREDPGRAERMFKRGKWAFTALALFFVWAGIFVGPIILSLMRLPRAFADVFWMVPLLGIRAGLDVFASPTSSLLFAGGASRYSSGLNVVRLIVLVAGLLTVVPQWGMNGAIWVLVAAPALSYPALLLGVREVMPKALGIELASLITFLLGTVAALAMYFGLGPTSRF
jgi:hypothetical protein